MTCAAVGGAVEPYIFMSGRPAVDPIPGMPGDADAADAAMPAGPSGPAQRGVITAEVTAITKAGTTARLTAAAKVPRRRTGWSASDGRHKSATHPAIRASSRVALTTSRLPTGSGLPTSGPTGSPVVRDATYTAMTRAFPAVPSHSHSRVGRHSTTAAQIIWAQAMTRKNTPYRVYSAKCSNMTAKWIAAAPTDSEAKPPSRYGLAVASLVRALSSAKTGVLIPSMLGPSPTRPHPAEG